MSYPTEKLGKYIDILSGFAFKSKDFSNTGVPVIKIKNITPPYVSLEDVTYVPNDIATQQKKFQVRYGDILIALTGSHINQMDSVVGRIAKVNFFDKALLNQRVGKIYIVDDISCNLDYVYYFLSQEKVKIELASKAGGAANQANISPTDVKNLQIPFPSKAIQDRIADTLLAYDNLIENNQKQIKLLEEAARRLYKEWFVDLRFPSYETTPVVDGVPEGWRNGNLLEITEFKRGKTITKSQIAAGNIPVVAGGLEPAYYHNQANTTAPVITVSGSGANAGFTKMYYMDVFASDCSFVDINATPYVYFVYCFLKESKAILDSLQKGSAQPHVYAKDINALSLLIPDKKYMELFVGKVAPFFTKIQKLQKQIKLAEEARDRLLPKLISGELEV